jgi:hypothetical protein
VKSALLFAAAAGALFTYGATSRLPEAKPNGKKADAKPRKVSYATDVAPILNARCVNCHRPGEVAPFSLIGYDNAKKWSGMVAGVTAKGIMPPWKAVHGYGEFKDENRLTDAEKDTLKQWHEQGAPRGDKRKEPATPKFPQSEWPLGEPDLVLQPGKPFKLGAEGPDLYRNFVIRNDSTKPLWVNGLDIRPGNKKIVHHVITFLDASHSGQKLAEKLADGQEGYSSEGGGVGFLPSGSLGGWAPGITARHTPEGTAFLVPAGTDFVLQVHYHRSGKEEVDQTKVGLYLQKDPPEKQIDLHWLFNFSVNIAPGEKSYTLRREYTIPKDVTLYGVMPHMHLLGRSMKAWLELPDGTVKPLVYVDDWDFNWQLNYAFKEPIKAPKGTKEIVEAVYDNSADNPRQPNNPPRRVTWGEATTDEMFLLISAYAVDKP